MPDTETTISTHSDESGNTDPNVIVAGGTGSGALEGATVEGLQRLTQLEGRFDQVSGRVDGLEAGQSQLQESMTSLTDTVKTSMESVTSSISQLAQKAGTAAQAVTEPVKEVVQDVAPSIKEHGFFKPWFSKSGD